MNLERDAIFVIQADDIIENALRKIEANKYKTVIVIDENYRVLGTLSDGDIRKALIAKRSLLTPVYDVMNTHYQAVTIDKQNNAKEIFNNHFYINLIPVINTEGILQALIYRDKYLMTNTVD